MKLAVIALLVGATLIQAMPAVAGDAGHHAAPSAPTAPPAGAENGIHWTVGAGGFAALTGPAAYGIAAELQVYPGNWPGNWPGSSPGHWLDRIGATLRYRGFEGWSSGMFMAGLVYAAGRSRPGLVLEIHGEAGIAHDPVCPVAGGGVRLQVGIWGPLSLALDSGGHLIFDGIDTSLAITSGLLLGLSR